MLRDLLPRPLSRWRRCVRRAPYAVAADTPDPVADAKAFQKLLHRGSFPR